MTLKTVNFFDGFQSSTQPDINGVIPLKISSYASDAAYVADQAAGDGSIYYNTTLNVIRYYKFSAWQTLKFDPSYFGSYADLMTYSAENIPAAGSSFFNESISLMQYYDGSQWLTVSDKVNPDPIPNQVEVQVSTAGQTVITTGFSMNVTIPGAVDVYVDGLRLIEGLSYDYTFTAIVADLSSEITLSLALIEGLNICVIYRYGLFMANPMTSPGDIIIGGVGGLATALNVGSEGQVLTSVSGSPAWALTSGLTNPMTTAEDIIVGGVSGAPTRKAKGTDGQILKMVTGSVAWANESASFVNPMTTAEDLIKGGVSGTPDRLPKGTDGQVLKMVTGAIAWDTPTVYGNMNNPMTTYGDIIKAGAAGEPERLPIGAENRVLMSKSGTASWEVLNVDDIKGTVSITNNQDSAADVTGALLDYSVSHFAKIDYSIDRKYSGDLHLSNIYTNIINGGKINNYTLTYSSAILCHSGGLTFFGGAFTDFGGGAIGRDRLIAFDGDGVINSAFHTAAVDGTKFSGSVLAIIGHTDGDLLISGAFNNYGTTGRNKLIKISAAGVLDATFNANAVDGSKLNGGAYTMLTLSDGKIAYAGNFTNYGGTTGKSYLIILNSNGTEHSTFNTAITSAFNGIVYSVAEIASGKLLVTGAFTTYGGTANRSYAVILNTADGTVDATLTAAIGDSATKINNIMIASAKISDGGFMLGGTNTTYGGLANRNRLLKFTSAGVVDPKFMNLAVDGNVFNNQVNHIFETYLKRIMVIGQFTYATQPFYGKSGFSILDKTGDEARSVAIPLCYGQRTSSAFWGYETPDNKLFMMANQTNFDGVTGRNYLVCHAEDGTLEEKPFRNGVIRACYDTTTSSWKIAGDSYNGESRGVTLSITAAGQLQYTSNKRTGTATTNSLKYFVKYL